MNREELLQMAELLNDALDCLDEGEMYAHHARLPVMLVLQRLKTAIAAKEGHLVPSVATSPRVH